MERSGSEGVDVAGRVAVVTGASKGIGVSIARSLHAAGMSLALIARSEAPLVALAGELGQNCLAVRCDVGDPDSVRAGFAAIDARFGRLDALVNNAGVIGMSLLAEADDTFVATQVAANLLGPIYCSRAAIPLLLAAGGGDIVNISSRSVELARPYLSVYAATKGGLETFSRTLAAEVRPQGIRVSAIRVGPTASDPAVEASGVETSGADASSVTRDWVARGGPAPEAPAPAQSVADAVLFVVSRPPSWRVPVLHLEP
jgi:NAD(P)-dependent dehydrogenase (short-subunit alcohol dehydrogenase family)